MAAATSAATSAATAAAAAQLVAPGQEFPDRILIH